MLTIEEDSRQAPVPEAERWWGPCLICGEVHDTPPAVIRPMSINARMEIYDFDGNVEVIYLHPDRRHLN